jgi:uncharacterized protein (TIGR03083 family)
MAMELTHPGPILVADRFNEIRRLLLEVIESLSAEDWDRPTAAQLWSVKDIAVHLLGGDVSNLSRRRDEFLGQGKSITDFHELVAFINNLNDEWVRAGRRMSPRLLCDLLAFTGPQLAAYFDSLDLFAQGGPVSWAGPEPAPVWLDVAREYTEQWHHQQQIRDATGRPPLYSARWFAPVLETFMRALPYTYRNTEAAEGTVIEVEITGEAGNRWFLQRRGEGWELLIGTHISSETRLSIPQDAAWRLLTKGLSPAQTKSLATIRGNMALAEPFFESIAVIA